MTASDDATQYNPPLTTGWLGYALNLFQDGIVGYVPDKEILATLSRTERSAMIKLFGHGPKELLRLWRVSYALWLMQYKNLSVTDAANAAGFCDASHLIKASRRVTGTTPLRYLREKQVL